MTLNEISIALAILISSYSLIRAILMSFKLDEDIRIHWKVRRKESNKVLFLGVVAVATAIIGKMLMNSNESILVFLQLYAQGTVLSTGFLLMNFILEYSKHFKIKARLWDNYKKPAFLSLMVILLSIFNEVFQKL